MLPLFCNGSCETKEGRGYWVMRLNESSHLNTWRGLSDHLFPKMWARALNMVKAKNPKEEEDEGFALGWWIMLLDGWMRGCVSLDGSLEVYLRTWGTWKPNYKREEEREKLVFLCVNVGWVDVMTTNLSRVQYRYGRRETNVIVYEFEWCWPNTPKKREEVNVLGNYLNVYEVIKK